MEGPAGAERALVERVRSGDEAALSEMVVAFHRPLLRIAETYVGRGATAEDIVQETWVSVVDHLEDFEGRSALKTWIVRILVNKAKTRRARDKRFQPSGDDDTEINDGRFSGLGFWKGTPAFASGPDSCVCIEV